MGGRGPLHLRERTHGEHFFSAHHHRLDGAIAGVERNDRPVAIDRVSAVDAWETTYDDGRGERPALRRSHLAEIERWRNARIDCFTSGVANSLPPWPAPG